MSSAPSEPPPRRWFRTFAVRLNAWYAFVLTTGLLATYLVVALLAGYTVEQADRQIISAKLDEYHAIFEAPENRGEDGPSPSALRPEDEAYFVLVTSAGGEVLYAHVPGADLGLVERTLERQRARVPNGWVQVQGAKDETWTLGGRALSGGRRLHVGMGSAHGDTILSLLRETVLLGFLPLAVLGIFGGAYLTRRARQPIRALQDVMQSIEASGDLGARAPERDSGDELDELSLLFNRMMAKQERLVTAMRDALDNVAHDMRTPLTRLRGSAENALASEADANGLREALADCLEEADRAAAMLGTLMDISEARSGVMTLNSTRFELGALAADVFDLYEYVAEARGIEVHSEIEPGVEVQGDEVRLFRAAANLLDNALKYTPSGRKVWLRVRTVEGVGELEVADEGPGIPAVDLERIWERLYRADPSRSEVGLGLGLSFVRAIVERHGGSVHVDSAPGQGARFTIRLPSPPAGPGAGDAS